MAREDLSTLLLELYAQLSSMELCRHRTCLSPKDYVMQTDLDMKVQEACTLESLPKREFSDEKTASFLFSPLSKIG